MAFALSYARADGDSFPMPASPVIVAARVAALWRTLALALAGWVAAAFVVAVGAGWQLLDTVPDPIANMPVFLYLTVMAAATIGAAGLAVPLRASLVTIFGHAQAGVMKTGAINAVPPPGAIALAWTPAFVGILVGTVGGLVFFSWREIAAAAWWRQGLTFLLLVGLLVLAVAGGARCARSGIVAWRAHRARTRLHQHVLTHGTYSPGVVTSVKFTGNWLDSVPVFVVGIDYEVPGGTRSITSKLVEYPYWAPVPGNQVDVWFDPAAPDDDERVLLHRRLVGQQFADEPRRFQRPAEGDNGPSPMLPRWLPDDTATATRWTTVKNGAAAVFACAFATTGVLALLLTVLVVDDPRWWTLVAVTVEAVVLTGNAAAWVSLVLRARWLMHTTLSIDMLGLLAFLGMFPLVFVLSLEFAFDRQPVDTTLAQLTLVMLIATAVGGVVQFMTMFEFDDNYRRIVNADRPAPPAEIVEALRSHDPRAIDALEQRYGFVAGIALLR